MATSFRSILQENGKVTIPARIRKKLGLKKGDTISFVEDKGVITIAPPSPAPTWGVDEIEQVYRETGINLEEVIEEGREFRRQYVKEKYGLVDKA